MKFHISEQYYKRSRPRESLAQFEAWRTKTPTTVKGIIHKDPILKKYPKIEKEIVKHEVRELKSVYTKFDRSDPKRMEKGHKAAKSQEPSWLRKEIKKLRKEEAKTNPRWRSKVIE